MSKFQILALNVSEAPSPFILDAFLDVPEDESVIIKLIRYDPLYDKNHLLRVQWHNGDIEPGHFVELRFDVTINHDWTCLYWRMPRELRGRFDLRELKIDGKPLLKRSGLV